MELVSFLVQRRVFGSDMMCNLPLKVVDFVDLWSIMLSNRISVLKLSLW